MRKAQKEAEKNKPVDFNSLEAFPTLNTVQKQQTSGAWASKTKISYKEQVDKLIEFEKMTEAEKQARLNARKTMEGWEVLPLKLTEERLREIHKSQEEAEEAHIAYEMASNIGAQDLIPLESYTQEDRIPHVPSADDYLHYEDEDDEEECEEEQ
jgi:Holliday junction resolvase